LETTKRKKQTTTENFIKDIRRKIGRVFSSEQKIQIVMEAMRAELSISEICRKYSISDTQFYKWNKEFMEAGKKRLAAHFMLTIYSFHKANHFRLTPRNLLKLVFLKNKIRSVL